MESGKRQLESVLTIFIFLSHMTFIKHYFTVLAFFSVFLSLGQSHVITGKVLDYAGNPISAASISFVKNGKESITYGTSTKQDGSFTVNAPEGYDTLMVTHINYTREVVAIEGNSVLNLIMERYQPLPIIAFVKATQKSAAEGDSRQFTNSTTNDSDDEYTFEKVEVIALFTGGDKALKRYFDKVLVYPDSAIISTVKGTVQVGFIVDKNGATTDIIIIRGINKYTDELVVHAVKKMPLWQPAVQNGRAVAQYKELIVSFDIEAIQ
jgi:TonB family protein